jgi:hypothetical protein
LHERVTAYSGLTGRRLLRALREGGYTAVTDVPREVRPAPLQAFDVRFEASRGDQAQADFAQFQVQFTDELAVCGSAPPNAPSSASEIRRLLRR